MRYPADWPPDCPPSDAVPAFGAAYRIVAGDPPRREDFLTLLEKGTAIANHLCMSAGLSLFRRYRDATHCAMKYPHLGSGIARAVLSSEHGATKPTPRGGNSHETWWPSSGLDRPALFTTTQGEPDVVG